MSKIIQVARFSSSYASCNRNSKSSSIDASTHVIADLRNLLESKEVQRAVANVDAWLKPFIMMFADCEVCLSCSVADTSTTPSNWSGTKACYSRRLVQVKRRASPILKIRRTPPCRLPGSLPLNPSHRLSQRRANNNRFSPSSVTFML